MMMDCLENLLGLLERVHLDKRLNVNFPFEHHGQRVRVLVGRASPISARGGIESHQIGQAHFNFLRCIPNDRQMSTRIEQAERGLLAGGRPAGLENLEANAVPAALPGERPHGGLHICALAGVQRQCGAVRRGKFQSVRINIDCYRCCAKRSGNLYSEHPDPPDSDEHCNIIGVKTGPANGLVRSRDCVRHNRQHGQGKSLGKFFWYPAQAARRYPHVGCKSPISIIARHKLFPANGRTPVPASIAIAARDYSRLAGIAERAGFDNSAALAHEHLAFLGDVIPVPGPWPIGNVLSIGDLIIFAGALIVLHVACDSRLGPRFARRPWDRMPPGIPAQRGNRQHPDGVPGPKDVAVGDPV